MSERDRVMQSTLEVSGALAEYEVTDTEVLSNELFTGLILAAREHDVLNLDLLLPMHRIAADRTLLENSSFTMSGTYQTNRDGQAITYALFRICVKKVGLAISQPPLPPTAEG